MKKLLTLKVASFAFLILISCGSKKETASSVAQKWCDLNEKVHKATDDEAKDAAKTARKNFEKEMQAKYKDDQAFMDEVGKEVEKCEDASEGR
jgi:hypothetical protein